MKIEVINGKVNSKSNAKLATTLILNSFNEKKEWYRKPLINKVVKEFELSDIELKDKSYNSLFTKCKSLVGSVLTYMINEGYLFLTDKKQLVLQKEIKIILKLEDVTTYIGTLLKNGPMSKQDIIKSCIKYYKTDMTDTLQDDIELEEIVNRVLKGAVKGKILQKEKSTYCFLTSKSGLDCKIYHLINESKTDLKKSLIKAISLKGGEFFEALAVKVLTEYFKYKNNEIIISKVTGGSEDNGIDGYIKTTDLIGKENVILMQAKVRTSTQVTLKEVREFYGAFKAMKGDIGIFMTNSSYHKEAIKFTKNMDDLVLVDGDKLYELCLKTKVGIVYKDNKYILDEDIFLNENFNK